MKLLGTAGLLALIVFFFGFAGYRAYDWLWGSETHVRAAREALDRRDFVAADTHLRAYLEAHPKSAEAHLLAAQTARRAITPVLPTEDGLEQSPAAWAANSVGSYEAAEKHLAAYHKLGAAS